MCDVEIARIHRLGDDSAPLKAFCDIIVSGSFLVKGLRVMEGNNGVFVRMPSKAGKDGKWYESVCPLSEDIRKELNDIVCKEFLEET